LKIWNIIIKFLKLSWTKKLLHLEAFFFQLSIGLLLKIIPFRYIPKLFATPSFFRAQGSGRKDQCLNEQAHIAYLKDIKNVTRSVSRFSPWINKCLIKSLAVKCMLNRRGIPSQLSLGAAPVHNSNIEAHAWIKSGDFEVVEKDGEYCELFLF
jgi:hypothetical protein